MTKTARRRIARYEKLLATLRRTEATVSDMEIPDAGRTLERTRENIATVESQLTIFRRLS